MNFVYLPGYSPKNQEEEESNSKFLIENGLEIYQHHYRHWSDATVVWDPAFEAAAALVAADKTADQEFGVIAKSLGTYVALMLIKQAPTQVKALVLMGIPVNDLSSSEQDEYALILSTQQIPITVIQNIYDSHGDSVQAEKLMQSVKHNFVAKEAEDHRYYYPDDILRALA